MKNTALKKAIIVITTIMITIIIVVEVSRKYEFKILAQSADALEIQIIDDGIWTSKSEIESTNIQVNNAINDLYIEAIEAGIDIEEVIQGAETQAEAIYLVQGALKALEQQNIDETEEQIVEEVPQEEISESPEETPPSEPETPIDESVEEETVIEDETPSKEQESVEEVPSETTPPSEEDNQVPPSENSEQTPPVEVIEPTIDNFIVEQTNENDSDSAIVNVSFDINANNNEISKITLEVTDGQGTIKEQNIELTDDNSYDVTGDLPFGNYSFKVIIEYTNETIEETTQLESEIIILDVIGDYVVNLAVAEGENPGDIILDLSQSTLPDSIILYDVYIDGVLYEDNIRATDNKITLNNVTPGTHDYQVVVKYFDNKQIQEIESSTVSYSSIEEPVISNFVINQSEDSFTGDISIDLSFDLQDNGNLINSISATATNIETSEVYALTEITLIESEEDVVSYANVATTSLPTGTYDFDLVIEYTNNDVNEVITATISSYELVAEPQPKTNDVRGKIKEKFNSL